MMKDDELEELVRTRVLRTNAPSLALAVGLVAGALLFVATNWLVLKGGDPVGPHLGLLSQYFIGYQVSFRGSLIGFAYAFVTGFGGTYAGARLYNWVVDRRHGSTKRDGH